MKKAPLFLILLVGLFTSCLNDGGGKSNRNGEANVLVRLERVGALAKSASPATIQMASLYITLTALGADTVHDTLPLSGNAQQTISKTYGNLASLKTWTLTAVAKDGNGVVVHSGSTTFTVAPQGSENVSLVLSAQYSMLKALFFPVRDSVTRFELRVDGNLVADSAFAKQALLGDTIRLAHDYLSSSAGGVGHLIRLDAYGIMWGDSVLLYRGDSAITVVSGRDTTYRLILRWVGPATPPPGEAEIMVSLGATGTFSVHGELEDTATVLGAATEYTWQNVGSAGFSQGMASYTSMKLDASGKPVIAFADAANNNKVTVMRWNGTAWLNMETENIQTSNASYISLALEPDGSPVVAFVGASIGSIHDKVTVMRWNGTTWKYVGGQYDETGTYMGVNSSSESEYGTRYTSVALDATGNPVVAFADAANNNKVTVVRWNGTAWMNMETAPAATSNASYTSLALDPDGNPVVAFKGMSIGSTNSKLTVIRWNGTAWQYPEGNFNSIGNYDGVGSAGNQASYVSLAIGATGNPVVAFADAANNNKVTVARWNGTAWLNMETEGLQTSNASYTSLALDPSGNPVVAFTGASIGSSNIKLTVMRWNGTVWKYIGGHFEEWGTYQGVNSFQLRAYYTSLALDANGNPVIAYRDETSGYKATVMRYSPLPP